jgi:hypothetical protein
MRRNIDGEVSDFIKSISDTWKVESLDGDETQEIADKVLSELDFVNGNEAYEGEEEE